MPFPGVNFEWWTPKTTMCHATERRWEKSLPAVTAGYWQKPEATAEALRGGWFHTGDMAVIEENGYIRIVDRMKDIIVSGGENVSSLDVEKVLLAHPDVYEAAVIPATDAKWGEVPKAVVVAKPGCKLS